MNYAAIKKCDVANGPGVRVSLFVSGCTHFCKGCFNSEAWDFSYGEPYEKETESHIIELLRPDYITGLTFLGGEPMHPKNRRNIIPLAKKVKQAYSKKDIWCYSGYTLEELLEEAKTDDAVLELLNYIDVLVDGRFDEELKSPNLRFKGSANQRIILVKKTLETKKIVLWEGDIYQEMSNAESKNHKAK